VRGKRGTIEAAERPYEETISRHTKLGIPSETSQCPQNIAGIAATCVREQQHRRPRSYVVKPGNAGSGVSVAAIRGSDIPSPEGNQKVEPFHERLLKKLQIQPARRALQIRSISRGSLGRSGHNSRY
jgi:hypothetical protein